MAKRKTKRKAKPAPETNDPRKLPSDVLGKLLGEAVTAKQLKQDLRKGGLLSDEGNVSLIDYAAYLVKEVDLAS